jgi:hypothetical protein
MSTQRPEDGNSGSDLGGFSHADSIEPGVLDEEAKESKRPQIHVTDLPDPEGLAGANTDEE